MDSPIQTNSKAANRPVTAAAAAVAGRKDITILITDSGLGGLSICADIAARLKRDPIFPRVSLIYYNAWPEQSRGYHRLADDAQRIRVFDRALAGMMHFQPDIILIACNTLSILYSRTAFSRASPVPVVDIVGFGVDMVNDRLGKETTAMAVLLGTVITITADIHRSRLIARGIAPERLVSQACDQLATEIEREPAGKTVERLVNQFADAAVSRIAGAPSRIFVAFLCTHFGYSRDLIQAAFAARCRQPVTLLNPNTAMADWIFDLPETRCYDRTAVAIRIVSRIQWGRRKVDALAGIMATRSAETADALRRYEYRPDLF